VDAGLARLLGMSRSAVASLIEAGDVRIDDIVAVKSDRLSEGQWLEVTLPAPPGVRDPEPVEGMRIVYDDPDLVVVDKPVGVAAHPSPGWDGPTVIGGAAERQGIVHRLDVGTSGVMAVAKSEPAYASLKQQFRERSVDKTYHAVVQGLLDPTAGTIDAPIDRHPTADHRFAVVSGGKPSITHYQTMEAFAHASLVEVHLETGRTHQIRVHFAAMRHPCVGDLTYGADPTLARRLGLERQWLHAVRLGFDHPATGERIVVSSEYPEDLRLALARLAEGA